MVRTAFDDFQMPPCSQLLGWTMLDAKPDEGWIRLSFQGRPEFCNPAGCIQGGFLTAMLDDTMGPAAFIMTGGKLYTPTVTMTVNFLAPAKVGTIYSEAKVVQLGKTVVFVEAKLTDGDGVLLATATSTSRLVDAVKAIRQALR
jgi:uncharacterized protein (TIGR00369 family)